MKEVLDKCSFCDKHLTVERLKNEKAEMYNSRERLYQEYLVLQSQLTEKDKQIEELKKHHKNVCEQLTQTHRNIGEENKRLKAQIEKMKCCINDLVHLGAFDEHTDEEYVNYQVHEALKNAEQFIKEIKEND